MRIDVGALMEETVSVANAVPTAERGSEDVWHVVPVTAFWGGSETGVAASASDGTLTPTASVKLQVAEEDAGGYVAPADYAGEGWTLRPGDVIVRGEVEGAYTASELRDACEGLPVATVTRALDLRLLDYATGLRALTKWASVLYAEAS